jgi:hypothetical protein
MFTSTRDTPPRSQGGHPARTALRGYPFGKGRGLGRPRLSGATFSVGAQVFDDLLEVLDAEVREGGDAIFADVPDY